MSIVMHDILAIDEPYQAVYEDGVDGGGSLKWNLKKNLSRREVSLFGELWHRQKSTFELDDGRTLEEQSLGYRNWASNLIGELGQKLAEKVLGSAIPPVAFLIRSNDPIDTAAALSANIYFAREGHLPLPVVLEMGLATVNSMTIGKWFKFLEWQASDFDHGESSRGLSEVLMEYLDGDLSEAFKGGPFEKGAWQFIKSLTEPTVPSALEMSSKLLPFVGGIVLVESVGSQLEKLFGGRLPKHLSINRDGPTGVSEGFDYYSVISRADIGSGNFGKLKLAEAIKSLRIPKFEPEVVKTFLLSVWGVQYSAGGRLAAELVFHDLTRSFKTMEEIGRAAAEIRAMQAVERRR